MATKNINKKESVVDYLKGGQREVIEDLSKEDEPFVKIRTATGLYTFIEYNDPVRKKDAYKDIDNYRKREERRLANKMNYGDERGRGAVFCDNQTAKNLGMLKGRPDYLRVAYRAYTMAQQAPENLRKYVYHNIIVKANQYHQDAEHFMLSDIQPYTFEVLPLAWRKCLDEPCPELEGLTLTDILETLTPAFKEGKKVARKMIGGRWMLCRVVGYEFNFRYGLRGTDKGANPYDLEYRVKNIDDTGRYPHIYTVKRDNIYPAFHAEKAQEVSINGKKK